MKNLQFIREEIKSNLSQRLKELRLKNKYTQKFVAKSIGICTKSYQAYEHGQSIPKLKNAIKLAKFYHVSLDYLFRK